MLNSGEMWAGPSLCKCGLLLLFPSVWWGVGGTQILFKQEDSLAVKLCSVCVIPFPLFTEFFRKRSASLFSTTHLFFLFF